MFGLHEARRLTTTAESIEHDAPNRKNSHPILASRKSALGPSRRARDRRYQLTAVIDNMSHKMERCDQFADAVDLATESGSIMVATCSRVKACAA